MENEQTKLVTKLSKRIISKLEQMSTKEKVVYLEKILGHLDWHELNIIVDIVNKTKES